MEKPFMVIACYQVKPGKEQEMIELLKEHGPILRKYGLVTNRESYLARSKSGAFLEIFEWKSESSAKKAHEHPGVARVWEAMGKICEFSNLRSLEETSKAFPHFESVEL